MPTKPELEIWGNEHLIVITTDTRSCVFTIAQGPEIRTTQPVIGDSDGEFELVFRISRHSIHDRAAATETLTPAA